LVMLTACLQLKVPAGNMIVSPSCACVSCIDWIFADEPSDCQTIGARGVGVAVAVGLGVAVAVGLGVAVAVGLGVGVGVTVNLGVGVGVAQNTVVSALAVFEYCEFPAPL